MGPLSLTLAGGTDLRKEWADGLERYMTGTAQGHMLQWQPLLPVPFQWISSFECPCSLNKCARTAFFWPASQLSRIWGLIILSLNYLCIYSTVFFPPCPQLNTAPFLARCRSSTFSISVFLPHGPPLQGGDTVQTPRWLHASLPLSTTANRIFTSLISFTFPFVMPRCCRQMPCPHFFSVSFSSLFSLINLFWSTNLMSGDLVTSLYLFSRFVVIYLTVQYCECFRCTMWWLEIHKYCEIFTIIRFVNTSFTSHDHHFVLGGGVYGAVMTQTLSLVS